MFLHWMVGMVYIFYFASFVVLVREVLHAPATGLPFPAARVFFSQIIRPGVLWFLRNLNDPDFHPVQEVSRLTRCNKKKKHGALRFE